MGGGNRNVPPPPPRGESNDGTPALSVIERRRIIAGKLGLSTQTVGGGYGISDSDPLVNQASSSSRLGGESSGEGFPVSTQSSVLTEKSGNASPGGGVSGSLEGAMGGVSVLDKTHHRSGQSGLTKLVKQGEGVGKVDSEGVPGVYKKKLVSDPLSCIEPAKPLDKMFMEEDSSEGATGGVLSPTNSWGISSPTDSYGISSPSLQVRSDESLSQRVKDVLYKGAMLMKIRSSSSSRLPVRSVDSDSGNIIRLHCC